MFNANILIKRYQLKTDTFKQEVLFNLGDVRESLVGLEHLNIHLCLLSPGAKKRGVTLLQLVAVALHEVHLDFRQNYKSCRRRTT